ncbi:hypothetical protein PC39_07929 [Salinisphaera sp. PC39]|uniref:DUF3379 family protein n=1 Tax=Salinisphaera sp. PC39 TaxID=1304156 RepID=UPI00333EF15D
MNCLDCRRALLTDPRSEDAALHEHLRECPACARYAAEVGAFETRLRTALRVPVPERLPERVIFARSRGRRRGVRWLAAAAVLVLGIGVGYSGWQYLAPYRLADDMIAHMAKDPLHRQAAAPDAAAELTGMGERLGVGFDANLLAHVLRARFCDVQGKQTAHFVFEHGGTRVTAFVLPDGAWPRDVDLERAGMRGRVIQTRRGVIALFCPEGEGRQLNELAAMLRDEVVWQG